jgi:hypothetical protein
MTIPSATTIDCGQLWAIADRGLFLVERTDGPDSSYPIVLQEVARHPKWTGYAESVVKGYENSEPAFRNAQRATRWHALATMEQERLWFELRGDVRQWHGTAEEWRGAL